MNIRIFMFALFSGLLLSGCGGSDSDPLSGGSGSSSGGGGGSGSGSGTTTTTTVSVNLGNGSGASFQNAVLDVEVTNLSAGGSTAVNASLVDTSGNLYTTPVAISFTSTCVELGKATINTSVNTTAGVATSTYTASGCVGTDVITASASVNNSTLTATGTVTVAAAAIGSIEFLSADPALISLKGAGGNEVSFVSFKVVDVQGQPVSGQDVDFSLNTSVGGISIDPATVTSDEFGVVKTAVIAGTVHTTVRVTASIATSGISTQSGKLTISTGIADSDSISLSQDIFNLEALEWDGETAQITMHIADRFNNPVPDGTAVAFTTEGGQIQEYCETAGGVCTVTWTSSNPRPLDGRVTLNATLIGEESFTDLNGNGVFDDGDTYTDQVGEIYFDYNENGVRDAATEPFWDYDTDGTFDAAGDGLYSGVLCQHSTLCASNQSTGLGAEGLIIMSGSTAVISINPDPINASAGPATFNVTITDVNGNPMPVDTTVELATTNGTITGKTSYTVPPSIAVGGNSFSSKLESDGTPSTDTSALLITVTTPKGIETVAFFAVTD